MSKYLVAAASLFILGLAAFGFLQAEVPSPDPIDVESAVSEPRSMDPPDDDLRRVLVVEIEIRTEGEAPMGEVVSVEEIASYAPKVFVRAGGEWVVRLESEPVREFFVLDPRYAEVEAVDGEPSGWIARPEPVLWTLVIPLYLGEERIEFERASVVDIRTETEIVLIER